MKRMKRFIFRFDDVCKNANMQDHTDFTDLLLEKLDCDVLWAVSPLVCRSEKETQRVFPQIWNAYSDYREFYSMDDFQMPGIHPKVKVCSHGLVHVDHRLLPFAAQEMSIMVSCALTNSRVFVPPFNKWNKDTEKICTERNIALEKFENGWLSMEYNTFNPVHRLWYLHAREWSLGQLEDWILEGS